jgi:hypothetical protein
LGLSQVTNPDAKGDHDRASIGAENRGSKGGRGGAARVDCGGVRA